MKRGFIGYLPRRRHIPPGTPIPPPAGTQLITHREYRKLQRERTKARAAYLSAEDYRRFERSMRGTRVTRRDLSEQL